ncbi:hypothetical protein L1987_13605 [Smallanthus sonchifolius]|uniref:Uncharacterized protein n=1 Tax=Smallanthus sonchifolius TaxID=185202 RepID=A0ACB9JHD0_9ASTR|nr:hypothetical protein L1987_13605 [Smallanthus sonchifolius]
MVVHEQEVLNNYSRVVRRKVSVWGDVKSLEYLEKMKEILEEIWPEKGWEARYIGGLKVFQQARSLGWTKIEFQRIAWIPIHGVPVQLWDKSVFDKIGKRYGKLGNSTGSRNRLTD